MTKDDENKIEEVCQTLDNRRGITVLGPYTSTSNGCVVEIESALDEYFERCGKVPEVLFIDDIQAFSRCVLTGLLGGAISTPPGPISGGYMIDLYRYRGIALKVEWIR